jgi:hypothetical protein
MKTLPERDRRPLPAPPAPIATLAERVAAWAGCAAEMVTERDIMCFYDALRDDGEAGWNGGI